MDNTLTSERFVLNQAVLMFRSPFLWPSASPRQVRYVADALIPDAPKGKWLRFSCFDILRLGLALKIVRFGVEVGTAAAVVRDVIEDVTLCLEPGADDFNAELAALPAVYGEQILAVHWCGSDGWRGGRIHPDFSNSELRKDLSRDGTLLLPLAPSIELLIKRIKEEAFSDVDA